MSFSKDVILSLVVLVVVLEADLGHKKIGWFRIARPFIAAVAIVPSYLTAMPTSSHNLLLQGSGAVLGILLGLIAVSPIFVSVSFDPTYRGWWARIRSRPGKAAIVSRAGFRYALIWVVATAARLTFAWTSNHTFPHALHTWLIGHQLSTVALTNALIFLPLGMDVFRSVGLLARRSAARDPQPLQPATAG